MACRQMNPHGSQWWRPEASFPLLAGVVEVDRESVHVRGSRSQVRIETQDQQPWLDLLALFDGRRSLETCLNTPGISKEEAGSLIERLVAGGLLIDAIAPWMMFHQLSSNRAQSSAQRPAAAPEGFAYERWAAPDQVVGRDVRPGLASLALDTGDLPARASFSRETPPSPHPIASETVGLQLAHTAYHRVDGIRRPVASAGGLDPIHLLTIGAQTAEGPRRILHLSDDGRTCHELGRLDLSQIHEALVPDPVIEDVIASGASLILICADPTGVISKYGSRGWRYALMETGAVSHQIALLASLTGAHCRPVGGFVDERVSDWTAGLVPLLMVVIAVEAVE